MMALKAKGFQPAFQAQLKHQRESQSLCLCLSPLLFPLHNWTWVPFHLQISQQCAPRVHSPHSATF